MTNHSSFSGEPKATACHTVVFGSPLNLALLALLLVSAAPVRDAEDLVRQGNAAFDRGDFDEAVRFYEQAEEHTTDPGQVAFNKAAALFNLEKYAEAESHYWLCLGDASPQIARLLRRFPDRDLPAGLRAAAGPRLAAVLYDLGNSVLQQSEANQAELLGRAVVLFDHCLRYAGDAALRADARHNLELAKELLRVCPKTPPKRDKSDSEHTDDGQQPNPRNNSGREPGDMGPDPDPSQSGVRPSPDELTDPNGNPLATNQRTPGKGNLAVLPDSDELVPMTPEDAEAYLRQAVERILGERREYQQQAARSTSRDVLDW